MLWLHVIYNWSGFSETMHEILQHIFRKHISINTISSFKHDLLTISSTFTYKCFRIQNWKKNFEQKVCWTEVQKRSKVARSPLTVCLVNDYYTPSHLMCVWYKISEYKNQNKNVNDRIRTALIASMMLATGHMKGGRSVNRWVDWYDRSTHI